MIIDIIEQIKKTSSKNEKVQILKDNESVVLKDILFYTYNPFYQFNIKKIKGNVDVGAISFNDNIETGWITLRKLLNDLRLRNITGNNASDAVRELLEIYNEESQEFILNIIKKDLRANFSASTCNKAFPKLVPEFKTQLANTYKKDKDYKTDKFYASAKLDGLRCLFMNGKLYTRGGKEILGFDHIIEELNNTCKHELIDGELYNHDIPFQQIQGIVIRGKNIVEADKKKIKFNIFAVVDDEIKDTHEMVNKINGYRLNNYDYITFLEYKLINNNYDEIIKTHDEYVKLGYEGIMMRSTTKQYDWKRSDALLKYKNFLESDFEITGVFLGEGKYEGIAGGLEVKGVVNGNNITSRVGSGFSDNEREYMWKNRDELVGEMVELKYQGLTDNFESLRFPVYLKLKLL